MSSTNVQMSRQLYKSVFSKANAQQSNFLTTAGAQTEFEKMLRETGSSSAEFYARQKYRPLIVCGPSGVGKGTLIKNLTENCFTERFGFSVSYTTRAPRPGEENGVHYNFVT